MVFKNLIAFFILILFLAETKAQPNNELVLNYGQSYYIGDLNPRNHLNRNFLNPSFGVALRHNKNPRYSWAFGFQYLKIEADDSFSNDPWKVNRNLSFRSNIFEVSTRIEFNFLNFDLFSESRTFSPYTFVGIGVFHFNPIGVLNGNEYELQPLRTEGQLNPYPKIQLNTPFGAGVKVKIAKRVNAAIEWNMRRTFTDYLDDVSATYPSNPDNLSPVALGLSNKALEQNGLSGTNWGSQRGDAQFNDWYGYLGFALSFRLTENPHACHFNPMLKKHNSR